MVQWFGADRIRQLNKYGTFLTKRRSSSTLVPFFPPLASTHVCAKGLAAKKVKGKLRNICQGLAVNL